MPAMLVGSLLWCSSAASVSRVPSQDPASGPRTNRPTGIAPDDPEAASAIQNKAGRLVLRAVAAETNEPIEGVSIEYQAASTRKVSEATVNTGEDGSTTIEWPAAATVHKFWFTARSRSSCRSTSSGMTSGTRSNCLHRRSCASSRAPRSAGSSRTRPASRSKVPRSTSTARRPSPKAGIPSSRWDLPRTDAQGRWRLDVAPKDLSELWANVEHPHHMANGTRVSHDLDSVTVLKKGLTVTGRVVDAAGRPVRGARALFGPEYLGTPGPPRGTTNERGEFTLENCEPGPSIITVQAEGFAPRIDDVRVEEKTAPVEIRLTEPGSTLRVKVVDVQGKPVAGAVVVTNRWRGHRSIEFRAETDQDGRLEWQSAPKDAVLYDIGKEDYMWIQPELTASEREQTVTLHPKLVISGRVTDAETGRPVPKFRAVRGWKWSSQDATSTGPRTWPSRSPAVSTRPVRRCASGRVHPNRRPGLQTGRVAGLPSG